MEPTPPLPTLDDLQRLRAVGTAFIASVLWYPHSASTFWEHLPELTFRACLQAVADARSALSTAADDGNRIERLLASSPGLICVVSSLQVSCTFRPDAILPRDPGVLAARVPKLFCPRFSRAHLPLFTP